MNGKLLALAVGIGVGYLLGSRAGRGPYEKVSAAANKVWTDPRVQEQVDRTMAFANDKLEDFAGIVTDGTKNIVHRMTAPKPTRSAAASRSTTRSASTRSSGTRTSGSKSGGSKSGGGAKKKAADGE